MPASFVHMNYYPQLSIYTIQYQEVRNRKQGFLSFLLLNLQESTIFFSIKFKKESFQYNCTSWRILAYHLILNFVIYSDDDLIKSDDDDDDDDLFPSDEAEESESDDGMSFFEEEETKSRFTNYSMTSSVLRRNEGW